MTIWKGVLFLNFLALLYIMEHGLDGVPCAVRICFPNAQMVNANYLFCTIQVVLWKSGRHTMKYVPQRHNMESL